MATEPNPPIFLCSECMNDLHDEKYKYDNWGCTLTNLDEPQCNCECHDEKEDLDVSELVTGLRASGLNVIVLD